MQEHGDIGSEFPAEIEQLRAGKLQLPQAVENQQRGGGVAAAAAETGAGRYAFCERDVRAQIRSAGRLSQDFRGPDTKVVGRQHVRVLIVPADHAPAVDPKRHLVSPVQKLHPGLQEVVPVRTSAGYMKEQVDLRRRQELDIRRTFAQRPTSA